MSSALKYDINKILDSVSDSEVSPFDYEEDWADFCEDHFLSEQDAEDNGVGFDKDELIAAAFAFGCACGERALADAIRNEYEAE